MYAEHNPVIADYMKASPEGFSRGVMFAVISMRQKILNVPALLETLYAGDGIFSVLYGNKLKTWAYLADNAQSLWARVLEAPSLLEKLDILCEMPGLGVVKAAFILQLMGYNIACLDSRNAAREGRNPREFRSDGDRKTKCRKAWLRKLEKYIAETGGRAQEYWDAWCHDVANAYKRTPEEISALHLAIVPDDYVPGF